MIELSLRARLTALYESWLDQDDLGRHYVEVCGAAQDARATSVRQFLAEMLQSSSGRNAETERSAPLEHPGSTRLQLLSSPQVTRAAPHGRVESLARYALLPPGHPRPLFERAEHRDRTDHVEQVPASPQTEDPPFDRQKASQGIDDPVDRAALADTPMEILKTRLGQRPIRFFFTVDVGSNGYRLWDEHSPAPRDSGVARKRCVVDTAACSMSIDLIQYPDDAETQVRAFEWCAELREAPGSELPDAVAYGVANCFEQTDGIPVAGTWNLMTAADGLSHVDLLQVNAFIDQHQDAEAQIEAGDLAFVWL